MDRKADAERERSSTPFLAILMNLMRTYWVLYPGEGRFALM
jgi:hypothetical protein